mmetsp:Transcript_17038/g.57813  ORF Transcript_17038/g.57813 Transcript_17038/m.57813 type:complete len:289 (+) Transcript_17038:265-1131(+)
MRTPDTAHRRYHTEVTMNSTSSGVRSTASSVPTMRRSTVRSFWTSLWRTLREMGSPASGASGLPASSHSTQAAMHCPKTAGCVPSTGSTLTRKPATAPYAAGPSLSCSAVRGRSPTLGFSYEYTAGVSTARPPWCCTSLARSFCPRASWMTSVSGAMRTRVGSALPPAPRAVMTRSPREAQNASSCALVSTSSMQSSTSAGGADEGGKRRRSACSSVNISSSASTAHPGTDESTWRRIADTLAVPTSASVATAWRLREDAVTWSKSMRRSRPTPERASMCAAWEPTPP